MSDHGHTTPHDEAPGAAHAAVRDALPALLNGRVSAAERAAFEAHLAACPACAAELRLLAAVRAAHADTAAPVSVDQIAAAVRAHTISVAPAPRAPVAPPLRRTPAWARRGAVRAFAATALVALGSGALVLRGTSAARPATQPAATPPAAARPATSPPRIAVAAPVRARDASLLGSSFSDLSEDELAAVAAAVDDPESGAPSPDPTPLAPAPALPGVE